MLPAFCFQLLIIMHQDGNKGLHYEFQENLKLTVMHHAGGIYCLGTIGKDGAFIPDLVDLEKSLHASKTGAGRLGSWPSQLATARWPNERVYELRSGGLIPMIFDALRGLVPEVGEKIIAFQDYHYSPTSRRIYNLPGVFVLKQATTK